MTLVKLPSLRTIFLVHLVVTYLLLGITVWNQFVSYPLFELVSSQQFDDFHKVFMIRTVILITPFALIELLTNIHLLRGVGDFRLHRLLRSGIILVLSGWLVTATFELPNQIILLNDGLQKSAIRNIQIANGFRLILWTLRGIIVTKMIKFFFSYDTVYDYDELT